LSQNLKPGVHPDADRLSVFVEGGATAREQELMLAHLAECGECRKAVFLMQPHDEPQRAAMTPEKRWAWREWTWRWLVPVGVPAVALACALIVVLIYIRTHKMRETPQQIASVRSPETERPGREVAPSSNLQPTRNADRAPVTSSKLIERPRKRQNGVTLDATAPSVSRQKNQTAGVTSRAAGAAPSAVGGPVGSIQTNYSTQAQSSVSTPATPNLPSNRRNFTQLQQLAPVGTQDAATPNGLANKKDLPALEIERASGQADALAGLSGRITDQSGAVIFGATVTLRDAAGKTRQTMTGADGSFHLTELPAGQYELTATATGFKTSKQSIELKSNEVAMLQKVLDVGAVAETVEVQAGAVSLQTESASLGRVIAIPSGLPVASTVSLGKRLLSLDSAGNLFLSRNGGKKWKKIKPQWAGKAVRIESTTAASGEASANAKDEIGGANEQTVLQLTTDAGTTWSSRDGLHWHRR